MKLMTQEILHKIPALRATENIPLDQKIAHVKFFTPWTNWTWYGVEYDPDERMFFGYVVGLEKEWGYFSLDELEAVKGPFGLKIERDKYFDSQPVPKD
jgi:hypothetical protein